MKLLKDLADDVSHNWTNPAISLGQKYKYELRSQFNINKDTFFFLESLIILLTS